MADTQIYDGHAALFGMDSDTDPLSLPRGQVSKAVNRQFRGGNNRQRPAFRQLKLVFANPEDEELFKFGNHQGIHPYLKMRPGRRDGIIFGVAGNVFYGSLVNENCLISRIATGNNEKALHQFFVQAEEWIYIQDGEHRPIFWNGLTSNESRRSVASDKEMPIGTLMAYAHGRVFVTNAYNQMVASDVMFGKGFTNTRNVQKFTETTYWNEGGYFVMPSTYGKITGLITMPAYGVNLRAQGELVVMAEDGAMSFDVAQPRQQWKDLNIAKVALVGRGCLAPGTLISVNGDAWYRSADGWDSYTNDRSEQAQKIAFRKLSREVNYWLDQDTSHLVRYGSNIYFDNRILGTVSPILSLPRDLVSYGSHRYFRGMIALDLDPASGLQGGGQMNFDGLWTGVRPTGLVRVRDRAFAMSYDADGENRLYEITKQNRRDNGVKKVRSHYVTRHFSFAPASSEFQVKRLSGGELWLSEIEGEIKAGVRYRPDNSPCWKELMPVTAFGTDDPSSPGVLPITRPRSKKWVTGSPDPDQCREGTDEISNVASSFQLLVELEGGFKIDRARVAAEPIQDAQPLQGENCGEPTREYPPIQCKCENDYNYLIVDGQSAITTTTQAP